MYMVQRDDVLDGPGQQPVRCVGFAGRGAAAWRRRIQSMKQHLPGSLALVTGATGPAGSEVENHSGETKEII